MKLCPRTTLERQDVFEGDNLFLYNFALEYIKKKKVLDVGTGYGFGANYILQNGAKQVLGIDIDKGAITFAKKTFKKKHLDFQIMDATEMILPKKFYDVILVFDVIEHLPSDKHLVFLRKIKEFLVNRGILLISTPNKLISSPNQKTSGNPHHLKEYTPGELKKVIKKFFPETKIFGIKIINEEYNKKVDKLGRKFRYVFFNYFGKFRIARDLISLVPKKIRRKISGEDTLPKREIKDFRLDKNKIDESKNLLTISKNIVPNIYI